MRLAFCIFFLSLSCLATDEFISIGGVDIRLGMASTDILKKIPLVKGANAHGGATGIHASKTTEPSGGQVLIIWDGKEYLGSVGLANDGSVNSAGKRWYEAQEGDCAHSLAGEVFGLFNLIAGEEAQPVKLKTKTTRYGNGLITEDVIISRGPWKCTISRLTQNRKPGQRSVSLHWELEADH